MEEQDYIQFEAYLTGDLSKSDLLAFDERLKSDTDFKTAFEIYKDVSSHLQHELANEQESADFKANLDVITNQYFNDIESADVENRSSQKSNFYKYAIAASVVILLGFFVFNPFGKPSYDDYNNFDAISLTVRSSENANFSIAEQSFNTQNYEEAIAEFNTILEEDFSNLEIQLYKSMALVETNQFEEADALLSKLSKGSSAYKNKAKWILALSYLKQEKIELCKEMLKSVPKDADDYKRAQELYNKLD